MNKQKIKKILTIISIAIIVLGIIVAIQTTAELKESRNTNSNIIVDGYNDYRKLTEIIAEVGIILLGISIGVYSFIIVVIIWVTYGIILLIVKIVNSIKQKKKIE